MMPGRPLDEIRLVVLDAFHTLFHFREPPMLTYQRLLLHHLPVAARQANRPTVQDLQSAFHHYHQQALHTHAHYEPNARDWWQHVTQATLEQVCRQDGWPTDSCDRVARELYDLFDSATAYRLYPDTVPFLQRWEATFPQDTQPRLVVCTNSDERVRGVLRGLGLARWLRLGEDCYHPSPGFPHRKPSQTLLHYIATAYACQPEHCLAVGDDWSRDGEPAQALGWRVSLIDRPGRATAAQSANVFVLASLLELYGTSTPEQSAFI